MRGASGLGLSGGIPLPHTYSQTTHAPQPGGTPYDQTAVMANRAKAVALINAQARALSRGKLPSTCGATGTLGEFTAALGEAVNWLRSPGVGGVLATVAAGVLVAGSAGFTIATGGLGALGGAVLVGAGTGAASGLLGQLVEDGFTGQFSSLGVYAREVLVGAVGGAVAGVVGLAKAGLGLNPVVIGAASGFATGAFSQVAGNLIRGEAFHAGVLQQAVVGAAGGAVAGAITHALLPVNAKLPARMVVGGLSGGVVSGGTHAALNVATGRDPVEGLGQAIAVGMITGMVDEAVDAYGDTLQQRLAVGLRAGIADAEVRRALAVFDDPQASRQDLFGAQNVLLDAGVPGIWQGGMRDLDVDFWRQLQVDESVVAVELGAGDYKNAIALKKSNPNMHVIATNLSDEWELGKMLYEAGSQNDLHPLRIYEGWLRAKEVGVEVGIAEPLENSDVPSGIGDLVYTILPYPHTASSFGSQAARIAKTVPGTTVAITEGGSGSSRRFMMGFESSRPIAKEQFGKISGTPYGAPHLGWERGPYFTMKYTVGEE